MGCGYSQDIQYTCKVSNEERKHETAVFRSPSTVHGLTDRTGEGNVVMKDAIIHSEKTWPNTPFLGTRKKLPDGKLGEYEFLTFREAFTLAKGFGSGLLNLNLVPEIKEFKDYSCRFFGIYSKNSKYWGITDLANSLYGLTSVPVYDTLGEQAIEYIFEVTSLTTIILSRPHLKGIIAASEAKKTSKLKNIIVMEEEVTNEEREQGTAAGLTIYSFEEVIEEGEKNPQAFPEVKKDDIYTLCYTSGNRTTGIPKGAMITQNNILSCAQGVVNFYKMTEKDVFISYLPLPHIFERVMWNANIIRAVGVGYYGGDPRNLKDDMAALRPTLLIGVPRIFNLFYQAIQAHFKSLTGTQKAIVDKAVAAKLENFRKTGSPTHPLYDRLVFNKVREGFGGRLRLVLTGSAPISLEVLDFLRIVFCAPFVEGYGQTENCAGNFVTQPNDRETGGVGGPFSVCEYKLVDVPELNYRVTDKDENGNPMPRGEICTRGPSVFPGYYKQEDKTAEILDSEGFLHSGDIGRIDPKNGKLWVIDRKKVLFKLAQGEYIAPEKLQMIYARTFGITEVFVYGDSLQSFLVAVAIPHPLNIKKVAQEVGLPETASLKEICDDKRVIDKILEGLNQVAAEEKLNSLEKIRRLHLHPVSSFDEIGLVTTTMKVKRAEAKTYFEAVIKELYDQSS